MTPLKKGILNKDEKTFIERNHLKMGAAEMASHLNRSESLVRKYVEEQGGADPNGGLMAELTARPEWLTFQMQFTADELTVFKWHYVQLMAQFGDDELRYTELQQIFDYIKCELKLNRNMREERRLKDETDALAEELDSKDERPPPDRKKLINIRLDEISSLLKESHLRGNGLEGRKNQILKELKGTREQRVKLVESSRHSFPALIKLLMQEDYQKAMTEQMTIANFAVEKERARLAKPHKYADGVVDQPLLTSETLTDDYSV